MATTYPSDTQRGNPNLPVYAQASQTTQPLATRRADWDPFFGYLGGVNGNNWNSQTLPRGARNGVPTSTHNPGDPNL